MRQMSPPHGPLQGVKVVSCSTAQAGTVPWMLMADLGADVIKIEVPEGGDGSRRMTVLPGMPSIGQKIELSLLGSLVRLMGWTFTTTMWRNQNPVTGQARITGTAQRPGISASFNDRDGKPLVFQLTGPENWKDAMTALGFHPRIKAAGFENLGVIIDNDAKRNQLLALLDDLFATGRRDDWVAKLRAADIVSAPINTMLEASNDPDVLANGYVTEIDYPKHGKRLKVHGTPWRISETPARARIAPELGDH